MADHPTEPSREPPVPPPSKHQLALMIWLCVFPTLTVINLAAGDWLKTLSPILRTFLLATIAVPIVIYGLMPHVHRAHRRVMRARSSRTPFKPRVPDPPPVSSQTASPRG
jgi:antibiotic biosynthesis monooxygenase (ABM) superfamily enzyme